MRRTKTIAFISALFLTCGICQPLQPSRICYVCGKGYRVKNVDAFITLPNKVKASCDKIERDGMKGKYHPDVCSYMMRKALRCGCEEGPRPWNKSEAKASSSSAEKMVLNNDSKRVMIPMSQNVLKERVTEKTSRMLRGSGESKLLKKNGNDIGKGSIALNSSSDSVKMGEINNGVENDIEKAMYVPEFALTLSVATNSTKNIETFQEVREKEGRGENSKDKREFDESEDMLQGSETLPALEFSSVDEKEHFDYIVKVFPKPDGSKHDTINMIVKYMPSSNNNLDP